MPDDQHGVQYQVQSPGTREAGPSSSPNIFTITCGQIYLCIHGAVFVAEPAVSPRGTVPDHPEPTANVSTTIFGRRKLLLSRQRPSTLTLCSPRSKPSRVMASAGIRAIVTPGMSRSLLRAAPRQLHTVLRHSLRPTSPIPIHRSPAIGSLRLYAVQNPQVTNPTSIPSQQSHQSSNSNQGESNSEHKPEPEPTGAYARFKLLAKKYGWYAFGMYWILSTVDFTLTFLVVHSLGAERIEPVISSSLRTYRLWRHGEEETARLEQEDSKRREEVKAEEKANKRGGGGYWGSRMFWAEALLAYTIHKTALLPLRAGLTVAWTPKVVKWLRARGWAGKVRTVLLSSTKCGCKTSLEALELTDQEGTSRALAHAQSKLKRNAD